MSEFRRALQDADRELAAGLAWTNRAERGIGDLQQALDALEAFWTGGDLNQAEQAVVLLRKAAHSLAEFEASAALAARHTHSDAASDATSGEFSATESTVALTGQGQPLAQVHRWNGVSRASFVCEKCGWELGWSGMIEADEFLQVELSHFECPICPRAEDETSS